MNTFIKQIRISAITIKLILITLVFSISSLSFASNTQQGWKEVSPIGYGGTPQVVKINKGNIYVGQINNLGLHPRMLVSSDKAKSWKQFDNDKLNNICSFAFDNTSHIIYFSVYGSSSNQDTTVYKATENFTNITPLYHGTGRDENFGSCSKLHIRHDTDHNRLLVADNNKMYYSDDRGRSFQQSDLPYFDGLDNFSFTSILENTHGILVATTGYGNQGIFYSTDNGQSWQLSDAPKNNAYTASSSTVSNFTFYSLTKTPNGNSIFESSDGYHWRETPVEIGEAYTLFTNYIPFAVDENQRMYISTKKGIWMKKNADEDWQLILSENKAHPFFNIYNGNLLDVEWGGAVKIYSPSTNKWTNLGGLPNTVRSPMLSTPDAAYIETFSGLYRITNSNEQWTKVSDLKLDNDDWRSLLSYSETDNSLYLQQTVCKTYKSSDEGKTFNQILSGLYDACIYVWYHGGSTIFPSVQGIANIDGTTLLGASGLQDRLLTSNDDKNINYVYGIKQPPYQFVHTKGKAIYAADGHDGVIRSFDGGQTWSYFNEGLPSQPDIRHLAFDPKSNLLFAAGLAIYQLNIASDRWQKVNTPMQGTWPIIKTIFIHDDQLYISIDDKNQYAPRGVYTKPVSEKNADWIPLNDGLTPKNLGQLMYFNNKLYLNNDNDIYEYDLP